MVRSASQEAQQLRGLESVVSNAATAPCDKAGFFCRCAEAAKESMDNNDCTNDVFLAAHPILVLDQNGGVLPDGFNSSKHMFQTWDSLRDWAKRSRLRGGSSSIEGRRVCCPRDHLCS